MTPSFRSVQRFHRERFGIVDLPTIASNDLVCVFENQTVHRIDLYDFVSSVTTRIDLVTIFARGSRNPGSEKCVIQLSATELTIGCVLDLCSNKCVCVEFSSDVRVSDVPNWEYPSRVRTRQEYFDSEESRHELWFHLDP